MQRIVFVVASLAAWQVLIANTDSVTTHVYFGHTYNTISTDTNIHTGGPKDRHIYGTRYVSLLTPHVHIQLRCGNLHRAYPRDTPKHLNAQITNGTHGHTETQHYIQRTKVLDVHIA